MLARKSDLAWLATSASTFAFLDASSACLRSVISLLLSITWMGTPFSSRCNTQRRATTMRVPSLRLLLEFALPAVFLETVRFNFGQRLGKDGAQQGMRNAA